MSKKKVTTLTPQSLKKRQRDIPESWRRARGVLKSSSINPLSYQRSVRSEWGSGSKGVE